MLAEVAALQERPTTKTVQPVRLAAVVSLTLRRNFSTGTQQAAAQVALERPAQAVERSAPLARNRSRITGGAAKAETVAQLLRPLRALVVAILAGWQVAAAAAVVSTHLMRLVLAAVAAGQIAPNTATRRSPLQHPRPVRLARAVGVTAVRWALSVNWLAFLVPVEMATLLVRLALAVTALDMARLAVVVVQVPTGSAPALAATARRASFALW